MKPRNLAQFFVGYDGLLPKGNTNNIIAYNFADLTELTYINSIDPFDFKKDDFFYARLSELTQPILTILGTNQVILVLRESYNITENPTIAGIFVIDVRIEDLIASSVENTKFTALIAGSTEGTDLVVPFQTENSALATFFSGIDNKILDLFDNTDPPIVKFYVSSVIDKLVDEKIYKIIDIGMKPATRRMLLRDKYPISFVNTFYPQPLPYPTYLHFPHNRSTPAT